MPSFKKKTDFKNAKPGLYLIEGTEITFDDRSGTEDKKGNKAGVFVTAKFKTIESKEHPDCVDIGFQDTYPLWSEFGFERFGGLMLALFPKQFKEGKDYPMGYFNDVKIQKKIAKAFGGTQFGSKVRNDKVLKESAAQGSTNPDDYMLFAKLGDVYDKDEYKDAAKDLKKAEDTPAASGSPDGGSADVGTDDGDEGW